MYEQVHSKYCYPDSDVLINLPGFKEQKQLDAYERMVTAERLKILGLRPLRGNFDLKHLCAIHKFIFKDVYPFAGNLRDEDISKGNFRFASARFLHEQTNDLLNELKKENFLKELPYGMFVERLTHYLTELNVLHPFREGNGRTLREFIRCLALESGYYIDWSSVEPSAFLDAMIRSPKDNSDLRNVLFKVLSITKS